MSQPSVISVHDLSKVYTNGVQALQDVSFSVAEGERVILLGHNGSGKSTLFRCMSQFEEPSQGMISIHGEDVTNASRRRLRTIRKGLGRVFQHFNLIHNVSVLQNVLFGAMGRVAFFGQVLAPFASTPLRQEALECLDQVGLVHLASRRADQLSGGQKQRVAIARMLMQKPDIVLADEPVASLDPKAGREIMDLLWKVTQERSLTVICILHQMDLAMEYGERIIALKSGKKVLDDTVEHISPTYLKQLYDVNDKEEMAVVNR